ncbi:MAG: type II toxin-antitoxin system VapC family toxin [Gammaproteobacteria bacterium]|nr:type II toxin-antitoxin system VapC family toxin [Gammaproteobacteria bacterium]
MITLDTNVLVRYLLDDDEHQAKAARNLLSGLTPDQPGFVCREVTVELTWVLQNTYGFSRDLVSEALEDLIATKELKFEAADDVVSAINHYREGGASLPGRMIAAAAKRRGAYPLYTFDQKLARLEGVLLLETPTDNSSVS